MLEKKSLPGLKRGSDGSSIGGNRGPATRRVLGTLSSSTIHLALILVSTITKSPDSIKADSIVSFTDRNSEMEGNNWPPLRMSLPMGYSWPCSASASTFHSL